MKNTLKNITISTITTSLNNQGIEIVPNETEMYLPSCWYEMTIDDIFLYVFSNYCLAEMKKELDAIKFVSG